MGTAELSAMGRWPTPIRQALRSKRNVVRRYTIAQTSTQTITYIQYGRTVVVTGATGRYRAAYPSPTLPPPALNTPQIFLEVPPTSHNSAELLTLQSVETSLQAERDTAQRSNWQGNLETLDSWLASLTQTIYAVERWIETHTPSSSMPSSTSVPSSAKPPRSSSTPPSSSNSSSSSSSSSDTSSSSESSSSATSSSPEETASSDAQRVITSTLTSNGLVYTTRFTTVPLPSPGPASRSTSDSHALSQVFSESDQIDSLSSATGTLTRHTSSYSIKSFADASFAPVNDSRAQPSGGLSGSTKWIVIGGSIGGAALILLALLWFCCRRARHNDDHDYLNNHPSDEYKPYSDNRPTSYSGSSDYGSEEDDLATTLSVPSQRPKKTKGRAPASDYDTTPTAPSHVGSAGPSGYAPRSSFAPQSTHSYEKADRAPASEYGRSEITPRSNFTREPATTYAATSVGPNPKTSTPVTFRPARAAPSTVPVRSLFNSNDGDFVSMGRGAASTVASRARAPAFSTGQN